MKRFAIAIAAATAFLTALAACGGGLPVAEADRAVFRSALGAAGADLSALKACRDARQITIDDAREVEIREARFKHLLYAAKQIGLGEEAEEIEKRPGRGPADCAARFESRLKSYDHHDLDALQIIERLEKTAA